MPKCCSVIRCNANGRMQGRKFFRFPMLNNKNDKALALTQTRQDAWIAALNRADFFPHHYKNATVCDRHFVSGRSAKYTDVDNVDWVPTLHLGYQITIVKTEPDEQLQFDANADEQFHSNANAYERLQSNANADEQFNSNANAYERLQSNFAEQFEIKKETQTNFIKFDASTQTDDRYTGVSPDIVLSYQERVAFLEEMLDSKNVTMERFRGNDKKRKFHTGLSYFATSDDALS